jgi:hypothetical protein
VELDLPPEADFWKWKLPFVNLDEIELNIMTIQKIAPCALKPRIVNGHLHGYD